MKPITDITDSLAQQPEPLVSKKPKGRILDVGGRNVPNCYIHAHAFILTGNDNREWEAYLAYKGTIPWKHSIPLSSVVSYLKWRGPALNTTW